mmetsp:Transcript_7199/g.13168  ORF Transcript_7199/g.13168 Transcript_7199/m.13168 type:complete len:109 (+) Transcript_7199:1205-1531(+)
MRAGLLDRRTGVYINILKDEHDLISTLHGVVRWLLGLGPKYGLGVVLPEQRVMQRVSALVEQGLLVPEIDSVWPLEQAATATERLETGHAHGKIILKVLAEDGDGDGR